MNNYSRSSHIYSTCHLLPITTSHNPQDISRSMFGLGSPPCPSSATRWPPAGLKTRSAMFGVGNTASGPGEERTRGVSAEGDVGYALPQGTGVAGPSEVEEDPLPLDVLPFNTQPLAIDRRVDDLLKLLRPTPRAEGYRRSVFRFVTRQVRYHSFSRNEKTGYYLFFGGSLFGLRE